MPALPHSLDWTYGAEHELSDWDSTKGTPAGFSRAPDYTIVNSNSIAAQPDTKVYKYGGEFNTPPTRTIEEQVKQLSVIKDVNPTATVNYRSNLHTHVRIPGLRSNLRLLKRIQCYVHEELIYTLHTLDVIPVSQTPARTARERRNRVSHQTFLTADKVIAQLSAQTPQEFFEAEVAKGPDGRVLWHLQPRVCVNLRQLLQTDTIEFRHFFGTLNLQELRTCLEWSRDFLDVAIRELPLTPLVQKYKGRFPVVQPFDYELEIGYRATSAHGEFTTDEVRENIQSILTGAFHGTIAYREAAAVACGLSRKHLPESTLSSGTTTSTRTEGNYTVSGLSGARETSCEEGEGIRREDRT